MDRGTAATTPEQSLARGDVSVNSGNREQRARISVEGGRNEIDVNDAKNRLRTKVCLLSTTSKNAL